jgi:hypothetical protein
VVEWKVLEWKDRKLSGMWVDDVEAGMGATDLTASIGSGGIRYYMRGVSEMRGNSPVIKVSDIGYRFFDFFDFAGFQLLLALTLRELGELGKELKGDLSISNIFETIISAGGVTVFMNSDFEQLRDIGRRLNSSGVSRAMPELYCEDFYVYSDIHRESHSAVIRLPSPTA